MQMLAPLQLSIIAIDLLALGLVDCAPALLVVVNQQHVFHFINPFVEFLLSTLRRARV
jgi:hypothetical protein